MRELEKRLDLIDLAEHAKVLVRRDVDRKGKAGWGIWT